MSESEEDESNWVLGEDGYYYSVEEEVEELELFYDADGKEITREEWEEMKGICKEPDLSQAQSEMDALKEKLQKAMSTAEIEVKERYGATFQAIDNLRSSKEMMKEDSGSWKRTTSNQHSPPQADRGRSSNRKSLKRSHSTGGKINLSIKQAADKMTDSSKTASESNSEESSSSSNAGSGKEEKSTSSPQLRRKQKDSPTPNRSRSKSRGYRGSMILSKIPKKSKEEEEEETPPELHPDFATTKVFGVPLPVIMAREHDLPFHVPRVVSILSKLVLSKNGAETSGIFRLCGHHTTQLEKEAEIDSGNLNGLDDLDVHTLADLLKSFLRRLPGSIIPRVPYFSLLFSSSALTNNDLRMKAFASILNTIPPTQYALLKHMCLLLSTIASNQEKTMMSASNLALIFAPSFLGSIEEEIAAEMGSIEPMALGRASKFTASVTQQLIAHASVIFNIRTVARVYKAKESFKALKDSGSLSIIRGDTPIVIFDDEETGMSQIMLGEMFGQVPTKILSEMKIINIRSALYRDTVSLFTKKRSNLKHHSQSVSIDSLPIAPKSAPSSPAQNETGHKRRLSISRVRRSTMNSGGKEKDTDSSPPK